MRLALLTFVLTLAVTAYCVRTADITWHPRSLAFTFLWALAVVAYGVTARLLKDPLLLAAWSVVAGTTAAQIVSILLWGSAPNWVPIFHVTANAADLVFWAGFALMWVSAIRFGWANRHRLGEDL